mmetsp:Transcript_7577/g.11792  ORF Transcript_7577/g.11792 Transcript_7577/m.11792 type:complete len:91 (-) Transcript_7577:51-323(-)
MLRKSTDMNNKDTFRGHDQSQDQVNHNLLDDHHSEAKNISDVNPQNESINIQRPNHLRHAQMDDKAGSEMQHLQPWKDKSRLSQNSLPND